MTANDVYLGLASGGGVAIVTLCATWYVTHRKKIFERRLRHYNSLVTLERQLMDIDSALHDNRIMLEQIVEGAKQHRIMIALPQQLIFNDNFFNDFYVLELSQKLYAFRYDMRRINFDIGNFDRMYDNFDADKTSADVTFISGEGATEQERTIKFVMSDEFMEDGFGHTGEMTAELRENTLDLLIRRVIEEKGGVPKNIETVLALKVNMPLMYRATIDMQNQS